MTLTKLDMMRLYLKGGSIARGPKERAELVDELKLVIGRNLSVNAAILYMIEQLEGVTYESLN